MQRESSPIFSVLLNAVTQTNITVRMLVSSKQLPPTCANSATPLDWLMQNKIEIRHATDPSSTHLILLDGAERLLLTSMRTNPASFLYNRESSVILETSRCTILKSFLIKQFENAWLSGTPHITHVSYTNEDLSMMTGHAKRRVVSVAQPDPALSELGATVTDFTTFSDIEVSKVLFGAPEFRSSLMRILYQPKKSLSLAIPSITDSELCQAHLKLSQKLTAIISYTHTTRVEADLTNVGYNNITTCIIMVKL